MHARARGVCSSRDDGRPRRGHRLVFIYIAPLEVLYVLSVHIKTVRLPVYRIRWNGARRI
jgi:hypothetical protein